jgi:hypothetical protein
MKARMSAILIGLPIPFCAGTYDFNAYCQNLGEAATGSYQSAETCQQEEDIAQDNIARMDAPQNIVADCRSRARAASGGYKTVETCINEELSNQSRLR